MWGRIILRTDDLKIEIFLELLIALSRLFHREIELGKKKFLCLAFLQGIELIIQFALRRYLPC